MYICLMATQFSDQNVRYNVVEFNSLLERRACSFSAHAFLPVLFGVCAGILVNKNMSGHKLKLLPNLNYDTSILEGPF